MRFIRHALAALAFVGPILAHSETVNDAHRHAGTKHEYQSDVARLRKIVIESLYSHREVFLRELISNANDAIEKLRLTSLTDRTIYDGSSPLNITLELVKEENGKGGRLIIADTGIGMTPQELTTHLGTLAKSGTSEFLAKAETDKGGSGNLIGAFGLGFYSSFLVADRVYVASVPPATPSNPNPVQHVFSSSADEPSFEIYEDPRGNTIGRGTEITLILKPDALEYLEEENIKNLVAKHSGFATAFPIYLFTQREEEVPIPEDEEAIEIVAEETTPADELKETDEDEAIIEDVIETDEEDKKEKPLRNKKITVDEWVQLNAQPPLWTRDSKDVTDEEYKNFYKATFKDYSDPLAWYHFKGDSDSVSFKALIFVPSTIPEEFWQSSKAAEQDVRLFVKRVFITNELGEHKLPKWISWLKVVVDADDLPLNVSRETLQSTRFLRQLKGIIVKRFIQMLQKLSEEDKDRYKEVLGVYNNVVKLGAIESEGGTRAKLGGLIEFATNQREEKITLDEYLEQRKEGQNQIFFLANVGQTIENLKKSIFVEKLHARGYEILLMNDPMDEILVTNLRVWKSASFQDVAKKGLKYGDENPEEEKKELEKLSENFKPLIDFFTEKTKDIVKEVIITNRLVTSPCAIVVDSYGYSANMEKLLASHGSKNPMYDWARKQRVLEINPYSPLVEGLLKRVNNLPFAEDRDESDAESAAELEEVAAILIDGALVRSGYEISDSNVFFERIDRALRRSLGVSETAKAPTDVKPAPGKAETPIEADPASILEAEQFGEWSDMKKKLVDPELDKVFGSPRGQPGGGDFKAEALHDEL